MAFKNKSLELQNSVLVGVLQVGWELALHLIIMLESSSTCTIPLNKPATLCVTAKGLAIPGGYPLDHAESLCRQ